MARCYIHTKANFSESGSCSQCKSCKHVSFRKENNLFYCNNCNLKLQEQPTAECHELVNEKWELI